MLHKSVDTQTYDNNPIAEALCKFNSTVGDSPQNKNEFEPEYPPNIRDEKLEYRGFNNFLTSVFDKKDNR